jgi:hypothetical protein
MTAPAGAAPAAVVNQPASAPGNQGGQAEAPTATGTADRASEQPRKTLKERAKELFRVGKNKADQQPAEKPAAAKDGAEVPPGKVDKAEDTPEEAKTVPFKAFKERLARESEKTKAAKDGLRTANLEIARLRAIVEIANGEVERQAQARQAGQAFDPRDEEIHGFKLAETARARAAKIQADSAAAIEAEAAAEQKSEVYAAVHGELREALAAFPEVTEAELREHGRRPDNLTRPLRDIAAEIDRSKLDAYRRRLASEKPPAPTSARPSGGGNGGHRFPNNAKGMTQRLAVLRETGR